MRPLFLVPLMLLAPVPLAGAECVLDACLSEAEYGSPPCTAPGDYAYGSTQVSVGYLVSVRGASYCYYDSEGGSATSSSGISVYAVAVSVLWTETEGVCGVYVYSGENVDTYPCLVAPPNPGWGNALP